MVLSKTDFIIKGRGWGRKGGREEEEGDIHLYLFVEGWAA
jgi:hypothetical protein